MRKIYLNIYSVFNKYRQITYYFIIISILLGVVLYDYIGKLGFTFIDELLCLFIFIFCLVKGKVNKESVLFLGISLFYLIYSFLFGVNNSKGIWTDFFIEIKPFLGFYAAYNLRIGLSPENKRRVMQIIKCLAITIFLGALISHDTFIYSVFGHPSRFATTLQILGFIYLYCSDKKKKDLRVVLLMWAMAMLSFRSKSYGFFMVAFILVVYVKKIRFDKLNFKLIFALIAILALGMAVAWEKISLYFIIGSQADEMFARPALFVTSFKIFADYIPFGSGLGSFASYASGLYYSPIYEMYGIDGYYGLTKEEPAFIADTFFPAIAQFGLFGLWLFYRFFKARFLLINKLYCKNRNRQWYNASILILIFFLIESVADATLTQNRGFIMMVFLAMFINQGKELSFYKNNRKVNAKSINNSTSI